ncbi:uncharacterized protein LOC119114383 [Pollicipes pollicipes]|uniref:uncharacterized protein LOC119114383 n=1 Tax=Pollicipes pollicipes TaxID=41117 RepID=UPI0018859436|nr:uncharacterized protein LOC119114383 [Pollicipes pollicipes]
MSAPAAETTLLPSGGMTAAPLDGRLLHYVELSPEMEILLNPLAWPNNWNEFLIRQFGFTLTDLIAFMVLSFFFWKVLVLFILPGIYFRVMLYTDEMEADSDRRPDRRRHHLGWSLAQVMDAVFTAGRSA